MSYSSFNALSTILDDFSKNVEKASEFKIVDGSNSGRAILALELLFSNVVQDGLVVS